MNRQESYLHKKGLHHDRRYVEALARIKESEASYEAAAIFGESFEDMPQIRQEDFDLIESIPQDPLKIKLAEEEAKLFYKSYFQ